MDKFLEFLLGNIEVKQLRLIAIVLVFLATIPTGFIFIYQHKPALISDLDVIKLIIFSIGITVPALLWIYFLQSLIVKFRGRHSVNKTTSNTWNLISSSVSTFATFAFLSFFELKHKEGTSTHIRNIICVNVLIAVLYVIYFIYLWKTDSKISKRIKHTKSED